MATSSRVPGVAHQPCLSYTGRAMDSERDRLLADLAMILEVSRAMGAERDLARLLDLIVSSATTLISADRSSLFLVDADRGELWTTIAQRTTAIRLPIGKGIAGTVASTGETINITAAYDDSRFDPGNDRRSGYLTRSILCMPLRNHEGKIVGVIQALNKQVEEHFTAYDEQVLSALCSQAAVAIETARLITSERERERLSHELELAAGIQAGLLPSEAPQHESWRFASFARPCDETGGDYYDYLIGPDGIDVVVGDVSGHGIAAALIMGTARAFLRAVHDGSPDDPGAIVTRLNRLLANDLGDDVFMSLVLCRLSNEGQITYVSAGHEAPIVYRPSTGAFLGLEETGLLLGIIDDEAYETMLITASKPGDIICCFTDGMWECADHDGLQLGVERFRNIIRASAANGAVAVRDALVTAAMGQLQGAPPKDDMTLVVVERLA
jgi:phosphoserine phosphatase RsbU/P